MMNSLRRFWRSLSPATARWVGRVLSVTAGLVIALILNYVFYRIGLPSRPFIYVAF